MKILFVGALAWNPERIRVLHEQGHELYGLWARSMPWDQGPYPVLDGCLTTVGVEDAAAVIAREGIDCVYALFQVYDESLWAPAMHGVDVDVWTLLRTLLAARARGEFDAPVVFHFGFDVHHLDTQVVAALDGRIFCNRQQLEYWNTPRADGGVGLDCFGGDAVTAFLDSDLPKAEFATDDFAPLLSAQTGEIHTVCLGRPFNLDFGALARHGIHVHVYGNGFDETVRTVAEDLRRRGQSRSLNLVQHHLHLHPSRQTIGRSWDEVRSVKGEWVTEFSRYDAAWSYLGLPFPWAALEDRAAIPNRLSTSTLAGLPVITDVRPGAYRYEEPVRHGHAVALVDGDLGSLATTLRDQEAQDARRDAARRARHACTFDATMPELLAVLTEARARYLARDEQERRRPLPDVALPPVATTQTDPPERRPLTRRVRDRLHRARDELDQHALETALRRGIDQ